MIWSDGCSLLEDIVGGDWLAGLADGRKLII